MTHIKGLLSSVIFATVAVFSTNAFAYPLLTFNAIDGLNFNSGNLTIEGTLTGSTDITEPTYENSLVQLNATLDTVSDTDYAGYTVATFINASLTIIDGDGFTTLLDGDLTDLMMYGITNNTSNQATMTGNYNLTSGSLMDEFVSPADFFALELNLSSLLNAALFDVNSAFSGDVYGRLSSEDVTSVPEPSVTLLFALGLSIVGFTTYRRKINS